MWQEKLYIKVDLATHQAKSRFYDIMVDYLKRSTTCILKKKRRQWHGYTEDDTLRFVLILTCFEDGPGPIFMTEKGIAMDVAYSLPPPEDNFSAECLDIINKYFSEGTFKSDQ